MRKNAVFQAGDKHAVKLQPLGRMHRHELHCILAGFGLVITGFQRGMRQESQQRRQGLASFKVRRQHFGNGLAQNGRQVQPLAGGRLAQTRTAQFINGQRHGIAAKAFLADKSLGGVDQFTQIFEPILAVFVSLVVFFKPAVRQHQHDDVAQRAPSGLLAHHVQLGHKRAQIGTRLARHGTDAVMQRTT